MYFLSAMTLATLDGFEVRAPELCLDHPAMGFWVVLDRGEGARSLVGVPEPPKELLADHRYPRLTGPTLDLTSYGLAMMHALDRWYYNRTAEGIAVGGILLDGTLEAQARLVALGGTIQLALTAGAATSTTEFEVYDLAGAQHKLAVPDMINLLLGYANEQRTLSAAYAQVRNAIAAAASLEDMDAVALPE